MFSGIIYCTGKIKSVRASGKGKALEISAEKEIIRPEKGMSIAVNGACLTASAFRGKTSFIADVSAETLEKTTLKSAGPAAKVNIEFPLTADKFLSGHIVQGHVDTAGKVVNLKKEKGNTLLVVSYPAEFDKYIVEKGSIAVDGVSLTAYNTKPGEFTAAVIPETLENTVISGYRQGTAVNLEFDIIGKYVLKQAGNLRLRP
jgi:riboflavin synthase